MSRSADPKLPGFLLYLCEQASQARPAIRHISAEFANIYRSFVRCAFSLASQMTLLRIATLPLLFGCCLAFGQVGIPQLPAEARNEMVRHCPSLRDGAEVGLGDLNGDGVDDVATIVQCVEKDSEQNKIVVLMSAADGRLVVVESASWEPHMRRNETISIKQKSIRISASITSYTDYSGTLYKFALHGGALVLVGLEYSEGRIGDDGGRGISANFLTKKLVSRSKNSKGGVLQDSHRNLKRDYKIQLTEFSLGEAVDALSLR
jgi:hypothetical protein